MAKLIMCRGLPASGKSTWAKEYVDKDPKKRVRINKDDLRHMLYGKQYFGDRDELVLQIRDFVIGNALSDGKDVVCDDTNLNPEHIKKLTSLSSSKGAKIEIQDFDVPVEVCIARNSTRANKVPEKVILDMYNKYYKDKEEGFKLKQDESLPHCIVVDIDGTVAIHNDRSPFDTAKAYTDIVNKAIQNLVLTMADHVKIIFVSGREEKYREVTEKWLRDKFFMKPTEYKLFMRPTGDNRSDAIIKPEIYNEHLIGKYHIDFVLDDRQRVVEAIRKLGLTVLQVARGLF